MIRVGIIGCGKIAQVRHLPEYAANPNAEIVAYYDKNRARAEEMAAKYGGSVCDTYFDLLNRDDIDAVSVCVENRSHAEISTAALYAGKHVLCEKPMAVTLAECESMVAAAERNGKYLMIGHNMRFDPVHRRAKQLLDRGVIGDVITFPASPQGDLYLTHFLSQTGEEETSLFLHRTLAPEWFPQSGVQLTWPHAGTDWACMLPEVTECYLRLAFEIARREPLLIVSPEPEDVERLLREKLPAAVCDNIVFAACPTNDTWARDIRKVSQQEVFRRPVKRVLLAWHIRMSRL